MPASDEAQATHLIMKAREHWFTAWPPAPTAPHEWHDKEGRTAHVQTTVAQFAANSIAHSDAAGAAARPACAKKSPDDA